MYHIMVNFPATLAEWCIITFHPVHSISERGFVSKIITGIPWISPLGIGAFLGTGGDFRAVLVALINLGVSIVCYYPFFKMYDGKLFAEQEGLKQSK